MNSYSNDVFVIDNSISVEDQNTIEEVVINPDFPWFYYPGTILPSDVSYTNDGVIEKGWNPPQFCHPITLKNSPYVSLIAPVLNSLAINYKKHIHILKLKFNFLFKSTKKTHHWPHADIDNYEDDVRSAVYYVNQSDGPTYMFKQFAPKKSDKVTIAGAVDPIKGSMVVFDSRRFHASSSPTINDKRIVLNIVFRIPKD